MNVEYIVVMFLGFLLALAERNYLLVCIADLHEEGVVVLEGKLSHFEPIGVKLKGVFSVATSELEVGAVFLEMENLVAIAELWHRGKEKFVVKCCSL